MYETAPTELSEPQAQEVETELRRLLASDAFRNSKRCREFLQYVVAHTLLGPNGALKERSIGVALFQLPQDFDTGRHTIVRVTANEVRKKLAQDYAAGNGTPQPVRIHLPPGSYSVEFRWETPPPVSAVPEPANNMEPEVTAPVVVSTDRVIPAERWQWPKSPVLAYSVAAVALAAAMMLWHPVHTVTADPKSSPALATTATAAALPAAGEFRLSAGSPASYVDRSGYTWGPDRFFQGGNILARPSERVLRTLDPDLYRHLRSGDFRYDIPLAPGAYELHLHFAETGLADFISAESSGEGQRLFRVSANGAPLLTAFDVVADADGSNVADERVFRNISPASDGYLHLSFTSMRSTAMLSGIELLPVATGKVRPIRLRAGWTSSWRDPAGTQWSADRYFQGGNALVRTTNPAQTAASSAPDLALYASERWGHFSYAVPVAAGRYRVTLRFCEGHYGKKNTGVGGTKSRLFDVYCNGLALLRDFDIFEAAGGEGRPIEKVFTGLRPNAQGKLLLTFVPVNGMACVNGIEVVEDAR